MRVLLVEDDETLALSLKQDLQRKGYAVDWSGDGREAEALGRCEDYQLVVLDLGLPGRSGLDVLRAWRSAHLKFPVIILTARSAWHEKVEGFNAGADDYLAKPFHFEELLARIQALVRRSYNQVEQGVRVAGFELDEDTQSVVTREGEHISLTGIEYRLLRYMMLNAGRVLSKNQLLEQAYSFDAEHDSNIIEVYIKRLRQKLGKQAISTRRGQGYVFEKR